MVTPTRSSPAPGSPGPCPARTPSGTGAAGARCSTAEGLVEDTIPEDISLVVNTEKGLVVMFRLRSRRRHEHPGIRPEERSAPTPSSPSSGGVHLFSADDALLDWTAGKLRGLGVANLPGCDSTGIETVYALRRRLGLGRKHCVVGAVGSGFDLENGIGRGRSRGESYAAPERPASTVPWHPAVSGNRTRRLIHPIDPMITNPNTAALRRGWR